MGPRERQGEGTADVINEGENGYATLAAPPPQRKSRARRTNRQGRAGRDNGKQKGEERGRKKNSERRVGIKGMGEVESQGG